MRSPKGLKNTISWILQDNQEDLGVECTMTSSYS